MSIHMLIVGCGKQKLDHEAPAKDMYTSTFFQAKRAFAEQGGCPWMIASAKYGLLAPDSSIEPYECSLAGAGPEYQDLWVRLVTTQWQQRFGEVEPDVVEFHAGSFYRDCLCDAITAASACPDFTAPMAGMGIGEQKRWYRMNTKHQEPTP